MVVRASQRGRDTIGLSVVVPVYNEGESIEELYSELRDALDRLDASWEIVFVNDGSTDDTGRQLSGLRRKDPRVRIVGFSSNRGLSAALTEGFRSARGRFVVSIDGDLQFDPRHIPGLLRALDSADVVCGWRKPRRDDWQRRLISSLAYLARHAVLGDRIHDSGCTFRAYRRRCVESLTLGPGHHRFLPYILKSRGCRVSEVPVNHRRRRYGQSKFGFSRVGKGLVTLISLRFGRGLGRGNPRS